MKKLFVLLIISLITLSVKAQVYVGGSVSLLHYSHQDVTMFNIAPEVGYNLNSKWAIGGYLSYSHSDGYDRIMLSPYARYSYLEKNIFRFFLDGNVGLATDTDDWGVEIGIKPGLAVKATDHLIFLAKYGFLGYQSEHAGGISGFSLNTNNISIGFNYQF